MSGRKQSPGSSGGSGGIDSIYADIELAWRELESGDSGGGEVESDSGAREAEADADRLTGEDSQGVDRKAELSDKKDSDESLDTQGDEAAPEPDSQDGEDEDEDEKSAAQDSQPAEQKPDNWKSISDEEWQRVPPSVMAQVKLRERQMSEWYTAINGHISPLAEAASKAGFTWQDHLGRLLNAERQLALDPMQTLIQLGKRAGIDFDVLADAAATGQQSPQGGNGQTSPDLDQRLRALEQRNHNPPPSQNQGEAITEKIREFAKANPGFDDMLTPINALIPGFRAMNPAATIEDLLSMSYQAALATNPEVRRRIDAQAAEATKANAVRQADDAKRKLQAATAKKRAREAASVHLKGNATHPSPVVHDSVGDVEDDLRAAWDTLSKR